MPPVMLTTGDARDYEIVRLRELVDVLTASLDALSAAEELSALRMEVIVLRSMRQALVDELAKPGPITRDEARGVLALAGGTS